ncbi:MAG: glycosyltransferase family 39 protein [Planctomycetes bacterium]|nr:glycosyltransferase family 39 protein [Planctomycetota bacterium]
MSGARLRGALLWTALLLLAHLAALVPLARQTPITVDEPVLFGGGRVILNEGWDDPYTRFQGPLPLYANQLFARDRSLSELGQDTIAHGRYGLLVFAVLGGLVLALWAREAFGPAAQILVLCAWAPQPLLLGYGALLAVDVAYTACLLLALYLLWRWMCRPSAPRLVLAGASFGVACATKYLALLCAPIVALAVLLRLARLQDGAGETLRKRGARALLALGAYALCALLALHAAYGFRPGCAPRDAEVYRSATVRTWIERPIAGHALALLPRPFLEGVDYQFFVSRDEHQVYLRGRYAVGHPSYYLAALATKTPETVAALLLAAVACALARRRSGCPVDANARRALWLAGATIGFALLYLSLFNRVQVGIRYVLPLVPLACFLGASAVRGELRRGPALASALLLLVGTAESLSRWPHLLSYFNRSSGGPAAGWRWFQDSNIDWAENQQRGPQLLAERHGSSFQILGAGDGPRFGRVAIHAFQLGARDPRDASRAYTWLALFEPIDHVGAAWLLFQVERERFERAARESSDPRRLRDYAAALTGAGQLEEAKIVLGELRGQLDLADVAAFSHLVFQVEDRASLPTRERALLDAQSWAQLGRLDRVQEILDAPELGGLPEVKREVILALVGQGRRREAIERLEQSEDLHADELCVVLLFHLYSEVARFADAVRWIEPRLSSLSPALREQVERKLVEQRELRDVSERYHRLR